MIPCFGVTSSLRTMASNQQSHRLAARRTHSHSETRNHTAHAHRSSYAGHDKPDKFTRGEMGERLRNCRTGLVTAFNHTAYICADVDDCWLRTGDWTQNEIDLLPSPLSRVRLLLHNPGPGPSRYLGEAQPSYDAYIEVPIPQRRLKDLLELLEETKLEAG